MKRKKLLSILLITASLSFGVTGCGSSNIYKTGLSGYTKVYDAIKGYGFEIQSGMLESATAVTSIADSNDYSSGTYLYKNGNDTYIIFNIKSFVISVSKNTDFGFSDKSEVESILKKKDLNGIWFKEADKPEYTQQSKKDSTKTEVNVVADVSITEDLFGTFSGKLTTIKTKSGECSMFMGTVGDTYKSISSNNKKVIKSVSDSLVTVSDDKNQTSEIVISTENIPDETQNPEKMTEEQTEEGNANAVVVTPVTEDNTENTGTQTVTIENTEDEVSIAEETQKTEPDTSQEIKHPVVNKREEETTNNQDKKKTDTQTAEKSSKTDKKDPISKKLDASIVTAGGKKSDLYHQLDVGQIGEATGLGEHGKNKDVDIRIDKIHSGEDAEKLLKHFKKNDEFISDIEPRIGSSFHIAEYSMSENPEDVYVDFRLIGFDGEKLKYRGVPFIERTYDYTNDMSYKDGFYNKLYVIYAVPNGCTEYSLQFGTQFQKAFCKIHIDH